MPPEDVCRSCGRPWSNHPGVAGTCRDLHTARARVAELEDEVRCCRVNESALVQRISALDHRISALVHGHRSEVARLTAELDAIRREAADELTSLSQGMGLYDDREPETKAERDARIDRLEADAREAAAREVARYDAAVRSRHRTHLHVYRCPDCGHDFAASRPGSACPKCGAKEGGRR